MKLDAQFERDLAHDCDYLENRDNAMQEDDYLHFDKALKNVIEAARFYRAAIPDLRKLVGAECPSEFEEARCDLMMKLNAASINQILNQKEK